jgi:hypothetical protein
LRCNFNLVAMGLIYGSGGLIGALDRRQMLGCANHGLEQTCSLCDDDEQTIRFAANTPDVLAANVALVKNACVVALCLEGWLKSLIGVHENMMFNPSTPPLPAHVVLSRLYGSLARFGNVTGTLVASFDMRESSCIHGPRIELAAERAKTAPAKVMFDLPPDIDEPLTDNEIINPYAMENGPYKARKKFREWLFDRLAKSIMRDRDEKSHMIMYGSYGEIAYTDESLLGVSNPRVDIEADTRIFRHVIHHKRLMHELPKDANPIVIYMDDNDTLAMTCLPPGGPDVVFIRGDIKKPALNLSQYARRLERMGMNAAAHYSRDLLYIKSDYGVGFLGKTSISGSRSDGWGTKRFGIVTCSAFTVERDRIVLDLQVLHGLIGPVILTHGPAFVYSALHRFVWAFLYYMCYNPDSVRWGWSKTGVYGDAFVLPFAIVEPGFFRNIKMIAKAPTSNSAECAISFETTD